MYKVLKRDLTDGKLYSPFQKFEYHPGHEYNCDNFDPNPNIGCSRGFYATDVDGLIYTFRNLPGYEVWECDVGGQAVKIDQFKRRYERLRLIRKVPHEEVRTLAREWEPRVGYKLAEALFPVNPLKIKANPVTETDVALVKTWASVRDSVKFSVATAVWNSVGNSVWNSVRDSIEDSVWKAVKDSVWNSVRDSVWNSVRDSVRDSVWEAVGDSVWDSVWEAVGDSVWAYVSSLFPGITKWEYIDHPEGENPFQPCVDLWHRGLVPSWDGSKWRLHAGECADIVWVGTLEGYGE